MGSAESEKYDQQLEDVLVGPVTPGQYRFILQASPARPAAFGDRMSCFHKSQALQCDLPRLGVGSTIFVQLQIRGFWELPGHTIGCQADMEASTGPPGSAKPGVHTVPASSFCALPCQYTLSALPVCLGSWPRLCLPVPPPVCF